MENIIPNSYVEELMLFKKTIFWAFKVTSNCQNQWKSYVIFFFYLQIQQTTTQEIVEKVDKECLTDDNSSDVESCETQTKQQNEEKQETEESTEKEETITETENKEGENLTSDSDSDDSVILEKRYRKKSLG